MALIEKSKPKNRSGAYDRLFGIPEVGELISRIQSTVISSGNELEKMILARVPNIRDLDDFLTVELMNEGVYIATKRQIKKCQTLKFIHSEPDFLVFKRRGKEQRCHVIELKDGHVFDTKKAGAERQAIHSFIEKNAAYLQYRVSAHFCCFNQEDKTEIIKGFKNRIAPEEAMTGREFCELVEVDYSEIVKSREKDQPRNIRFFLSELVKIEKVREVLKELLKNGNG